MNHPRQHRPREVVAALELIPGHAATAAEVWLWHGPTPGIDEQPTAGDQPGDAGRPRIVLRADDWPMHADSARQLAAALLSAAERADTAVPPTGRRAAIGDAPEP